METVLIVEDDRVYARATTNWLVKNGINARYVLSVDNAKEFLDNHDVDLVLSDFRLDNGNGMELLEWMNTHGYRIPFLIMTGYGDIPGAVEAVKKGADNYLPKPVQTEEVLGVIRELLERKKKRTRQEQAFYVCKSPPAVRLQEMVRLVAPADSLSVLIRGASGTGKEWVARQIHAFSKRSAAPFVAVDCGALSPSLIQSAFFGHVKGAFTGAEANKTGYFLEADGGTLFLDEVGNLTMEMQQMLLRAIQERRYRPVGAKEDKTANVRIVAATNEDLQKAVTEKRFRQDLLYRLQEYVITMPPLRDCPEDIMPLAEFFREMANRELEREVKGFAASARNALLAHAWPGNVRELKQKIQTAVLQSEGDMITEADLELDNEPSATSACFTLKSGDEERGRILRALKQAAGNKKMAAKILGIGRTTLYNKLVEYGLNEEN